MIHPQHGHRVLNSPCLFALGALMAVVGSTGLLGSPDANAAEDAARITYDDHVRPILREHCFTCHNQNSKKSGLALDSYATLMEGGSSGEVVWAEDPDSSRLWALMNHDEEPFMPPNQDKIDAKKLALIKQWIEGGAPENAGATVTKKKTSSAALAMPASTGRPENPAMPSGLWKQPVLHTARTGAVTAVAASPWAPVVAVAGVKQIVLYHSDTGEMLGVLPFLEGVPYAIRFSRNGALLLAGGGRGGHSGYVAIYDVKTGRRLVRVGDELDVVFSADLNNDHSRIALGGPAKIVRIYATDTGQLLHEIKKHTDWVRAVRYSPDGVLLATGDRSNGLFVWEAGTAREYLDLRGHTGPINEVAWRPDSNVLASASTDGTVRLWEMNDGKAIKSWNAHSGGAMSVAYTHDGRIVTAGRDKTAKLWSGDGKLIKAFPSFAQIALEATFTHDGKRLVAGDWSGDVRMWETEDASQVALLTPNPVTLEMVQLEAHRQFDAASKSVQELHAALVAAQNALAANEKLVNTASEQVALANAAVEKTNAELAAAQTSAAELAAAVQTAAEALAVAEKSDAEDSVAMVASAKAAVQKAEADKVAGDQLVVSRTAAVADAAKQAATAKSQLDKATSETAAAKNELAAKQTPLDVAQKSLDAAKLQLDQADAELAAFHKAGQDLAAAAEDARLQAEEAQSRADQLEAQRKAFEEAYPK